MMARSADRAKIVTLGKAARRPSRSSDGSNPGMCPLGRGPLVSHNGGVMSTAPCGRPTAVIELSDTERAPFEGWVSRRSLAQGVGAEQSHRAGLIAGMTNQAIAAAERAHPTRVSRWRTALPATVSTGSVMRRVEGRSQHRRRDGRTGGHRHARVRSKCGERLKPPARYPAPPEARPVV